VLEAIHADMPPFDFPHTIDLHPRTRPDQVGERIREATIVIACVVPVTPADMDRAPYLGILSVMAVGIGWVDKEDCARRGVTVTNCVAGNVTAVTEHFLGLYFAARKRVVQIHNRVTTTTEWHDKGTLTKLWPSGPPMGCGQETLAIMGYGTLGKRIESLAKAVGFGSVLISERKQQSTAVRPGRVSFQECVRRASVVCLCLPKEPDTVDLIAEAELKAMRPDALVINVARGGIVNESALAKALREGWIAGAATDVLEVEPAGPGSGPLTPDLTKEDEVPNLTICRFSVLAVLNLPSHLDK
jgi:glycerate dehydrogenase